MNKMFKDEEVREIRELKRSGLSAYVLAKRFGVSRSSIMKICYGETYKHVGGEILTDVGSPRMRIIKKYFTFISEGIHKPSYRRVDSDQLLLYTTKIDEELANRLKTDLELRLRTQVASLKLKMKYSKSILDDLKKQGSTEDFLNFLIELNSKKTWRHDL